MRGMFVLDHLTISNCTIATTNLQPESEQRTKYFTKLSRLQISSNISHSQVRDQDLVRGARPIGCVLIYFNDIILVPGVDWSRLQSDQSPDRN